MVFRLQMTTSVFESLHAIAPSAQSSSQPCSHLFVAGLHVAFVPQPVISPYSRHESSSN